MNADRQAAWKQFRRFLSKNKALKAYDANLKANIDVSIDVKVSTFNEDMSNAILGAFVWADTPEGQEYWDKLNEKWMEFNV